MRPLTPRESPIVVEKKAFRAPNSSSFAEKFKALKDNPNVEGPKRRRKK